MKKITIISIVFLTIILVFFFTVSSMVGCNKTDTFVCNKTNTIVVDNVEEYNIQYINDTQYYNSIYENCKLIITDGKMPESFQETDRITGLRNYRSGIEIFEVRLVTDRFSVFSYYLACNIKGG